MTKQSDLYWLAGFLEGEGSFMAQKPASYKSRKSILFNIMVVSTDYDVIKRAANMFNVNVHRHNGTQKRWSRKACYSARIVNKRAIGWMMTLYSLMGSRRKSKIKEIIIIWREHSNREQKAFRPNPPISDSSIIGWDTL